MPRASRSRSRARRRRSSEPRAQLDGEQIPRPRRAPPGMGEESVWDYPRPPALEESDSHVEVWFAGERIASTHRALRVLETSHPPVYYIPKEDCREGIFEEVPKRRTLCEHKGRATYFDIVLGEARATGAAWTYQRPRNHYGDLRGHVAFYAGQMERCVVDGESVQAQPGSYYGGWITRELIGPFKGRPGTEGW